MTSTLQSVPEFTTKLEGPASYPIWLQEFILKLTTNGTPRFNEYFLQGDTYFSTDERKKTRETLEDYYSLMLVKGTDDLGQRLSMKIGN